MELFRQRIEDLKAEITKHNKAYYEQDNPTISDFEYDELFRELKKLEELYRDFKFSTPAENFQQKSCPFYALKAEEMTDEQMVIGKDRMESLAILEAHLKKLIISGEWNGGSWYWIGNENLVLLKDWFKE